MNQLRFEMLPGQTARRRKGNLFRREFIIELCPDFVDVIVGADTGVTLGIESGLGQEGQVVHTRHRVCVKHVDLAAEVFVRPGECVKLVVDAEHLAQAGRGVAELDVRVGKAVIVA